MKSITYYDFDLHSTPEQRWGPIFDEYSHKLDDFRKILKQLLSSYGLDTEIIKFVYSATLHMTSSNNIMFYDEILYISHRIKLDPHEVLLLQLIYEVSSACTCAVIKIDAKEIFFRTMDWPMTFLKDITIGLNIRSGEEYIGRVITWLGYVGYLTATNIKYNYTIAINYRRTTNISLTSLARNFFRTIYLAWPIGYLVRHIIDNITTN